MVRLFFYAAIALVTYLAALDTVLAQPSPGRPWLGVGLRSDGSPGVLIDQVFAGSPAEAAGIQVGDRVLRVAGGAVPDPAAMQQAVSAHAVGQSIELEIQRQGRPQTLRAVLVPMPSYEERLRSHLLNKPAPPIQVTRVRGGSALGPLDLKSLRGRVVLLKLWSSHCPACIRAVPIMKQIHKDQGGRGLEILAVMRDPVATAASLQHSLQLPYTVAADPQGGVMRAYQVSPIPAFVLIDRKGVVAGLAVGGFWPRELTQLLKVADGLLAKPASPGPGARGTPHSDAPPRRPEAH